MADINTAGLRNTRPRQNPHSVADVRFRKGKPSDEAPVTCACGWEGTVGEARGHGLQVKYAWHEEFPPPELKPRSVPNGEKVRCVNGHEYTTENTIWAHKPDGMRRLCRTCVSAQQAAKYQRRKAAA